MGGCGSKKVVDPGSALDLVISQASSDDCVLYRLADYHKGGRLLEEYARGGGKEVERLVLEEFGVFMYNNGRGKEITRTEYLKWRYRKVPKDQLVVNMESKSPFDPLHKWNDHEACWQMQFRGSLGETLLHVLIMCNTKAHTRVAKILLKCFPKLAVDVVEGEEYLGASALHLGIAYSNNELVTILLGCNSDFSQRALGSFFLPRDQLVMNPPGPAKTDYEGLAYLGEYPLSWAACLGNETVYNKLIDYGADPDLQDTFGNMVLHMVVVCNQLGMFSYALRHPRIPAQDGVMNEAGLTPLTLACKLARSTIFKEMLELTCIEFWRYSNITCSAYPLNALDTIRPSGETNWNSALMIILNGTKSEHLDMLEGGIIQRLLEEKWKTFARNQFLKRLAIMLLQLILLSVAVYLRPCYCGPKDMNKYEPDMRDLLHKKFFSLDADGIARYCFEAGVLGGVVYVVFQQSEEIMNQGFASFLRGLASNLPKAIFMASNVLIMMCVPFRIVYFFSPAKDPYMRFIEDELLSYAVAGSWFMLMFFAGALKLTGPFVVMIYKMISGDLFTFSIIYSIMLHGFAQSFYFLYKSPRQDSESNFYNYKSTWMALFHMTLGDYDYGAMSVNIYSDMTKFVFLVFTIMVPILLLNMLIAMMANTYSTVISMSEKEWVKAWAKIVIALERAISQEKAKEYIYMYSMPLGGGGEGGEESLGVLVIKCKDKTKAKQRKGALSNWKRVGRVTIDALARRGVTGEFLRREMWGLQTAASTPVKGPTKKKGYGGLLGNDTGPGTLDIMGEALDQSLFAGDDIDPNDEMDGFGALTGAIDQLAFTNDLDFSGDGVDDDPIKQLQTGPAGAPNSLAPPGRNNAAAEAKRKKQKKKRMEGEGHDNPAFLDDEQLLLAASLVPTADDSDSDTDLEAARRLKQPRIIIQAETPAVTATATATVTATAAVPGKAVPAAAKTAPAATKDAKGKVTKEPPPPPILPQPRLPSAKVRRIGSARRTPAKFTMTFTEKYTPIPASRGCPPPPPPAAGTPAAPSTQAPPPAQPETKGQKEVGTKKKKEEKESKRQATAAAAAATTTTTTTKEEQSQEDKWAEKKGKGSRNKVAPSSSSSLEEASGEARAQDDLGVGLATEEGQEAKAGQRQRPKTSVAPSQKMKQRATQEVGNMNTILPWDNEDGDIK